MLRDFDYHLCTTPNEPYVEEDAVCALPIVLLNSSVCCTVECSIAKSHLFWLMVL